jgi:hypothetical protein
VNRMAEEAAFNEFVVARSPALMRTAYLLAQGSPARRKRNRRRAGPVKPGYLPRQSVKWNVSSSLVSESSRT